MRKSRFLVCLLLLAAATLVHADNIIFTQPTTGALAPGNWNTATRTLGSGPSAIQVHAYQFVGGSWVDANLFGRNQTNDRGIGVCSTADANNCGTGSGGGDFNELDNSGANELIVLTLPTNYIWQSVQVSSLDTNGSSNSNLYERGVLRGSSTGNPNASPTFTLLCNFVTGGPANNLCTYGSGIEPTLTLTGGKDSKYLYFTAYDWKNGTNTNNDYLVLGATVTPVPEPASLIMLGSGLLGAATTLRRRFKK